MNFGVCLTLVSFLPHSQRVATILEFSAQLWYQRQAWSMAYSESGLSNSTFVALGCLSVVSKKATTSHPCDYETLEMYQLRL